MVLESKKKKDCCGCTACSKICPVSAIKMRQDKKGFYYPVVDKAICTGCGLCEKACPMRENYVGQEAEPDCYALRNKKKEVLTESSSGGMFSLLAEEILSRGGTVYGAAFDESFCVRHMRAVTKEEAERFRTSKYVESDFSGIYEQVGEDLKLGKDVLLTGTPCQISAAGKYLALKKINTDKLYTCDNICHGVPSRKMWADYLGILKEKYMEPGDAIAAVNMRSKKVSWKQQVMDIALREGDIERVVGDFSFNKFFLSLFGNRSSCFHCRYTSYKRPGDITLGDFWNVENAGISFDVEGGVNVVLVNSQKGRELFDKVREKAEVQKVTKQDCWQPHLEYAAKRPAKWGAFWNDYLSAGHQEKERVMRKYMKGSMLTRVIRFVTPILRKTGLYGLAGKMYKLVFLRKKTG